MDSGAHRPRGSENGSGASGEPTLPHASHREAAALRGRLYFRRLLLMTAWTLENCREERQRREQRRRGGTGGEGHRGSQGRGGGAGKGNMRGQSGERGPRE